MSRFLFRFSLLLALALRVEAADAAKVAAAYKKSVELVKTGKTKEGFKLLTRIVELDPSHVPARVLRARLLHKAGKRETAIAEARAILKLDPANKVALAITGEPPTSATLPTVKVEPAAAEYSSYDLVWNLPGAKPFELPDFLGQEGTTVFHWPGNADHARDFDTFEVEAQDKKLYYLRVVDLFGEGQEADLELPGAKEHGVTEVPFMVLVGPDGKETVRGKPEQVEAQLAAIRQEAIERQKAEEEANAPPVDTIVSEDFSSSDDIESLGVKGWSTVVMVTSPA